MLIGTVGPLDGTRWVRRLDDVDPFIPLRVVATLVIAVAATILARMFISRWLRHVLGLFGKRDPHGGARHRALVSVLSSALMSAIWIIAVFVMADEIGVNITGLVATATVIGGAIAFGAQTLIRDVISGVFVLAEDQYGVGDVVDVGVATGLVKRITLRSVCLRDDDGRIWHVPHGGVTRVANLSRARSVMLDAAFAPAEGASTHLEALERLITDLVHRHAGLLGGVPRVVGLVELTPERATYRVEAPTQVDTQAQVRRAWREVLLDAAGRDEVLPIAAS